MPRYRTVKFKIQDFTPHTLPMARLAEYLADFAALLGNEQAVHFRRVADGSAELISEVDEPEFAVVRRRAQDAAKGFGPPEAIRAYRSINAKLKQDSTTGQVEADRGARILRFPGVHAEEPVTFGPFNQQGALDGVLIKIGGKDETIPVHLEDEGRNYICNATREMAKKLAPYLFGNPIRVHGTGRWTRDANGSWVLIGFNIANFEPLDNDPLPVVVERLREIPNNEWQKVGDPLGELKRIRRGNGKAV